MIGCLLLLSGCAAIDPVPYDPSSNAVGPPGWVWGERASPPKWPDSLSKQMPLDQSSEILPFWPAGDDTADSLKNDADYMRYLGASYELARNEVLKQRPLFDLTTVSLGAAAAVNGLFEGSKIATSALGFTAAGSAATQIYFAPGIKIEAYDNAWAALDCGADVADQIRSIAALQHDPATPDPLYLNSALSDASAALVKEIVNANTALLDADAVTGEAPDVKVTLQNDEKAVNAAISAANVALLNAQGAQALLQNSSLQLQDFTDAVIKITSNRVMTGENDSTQLLALLKTAQTSSPLTGTSSILALQQNQAVVSAPNTPLVLNEGDVHASAPPPLDSATADNNLLRAVTILNAQAILTQQRTDDFNSAWSNLTTCALRTT
jgi:hypothetical protein